MPISAVDVETLFVTLVSVNRPVTAEGVTSNVLPLPLLTAMSASNTVQKFPLAEALLFIQAAALLVNVPRVPGQLPSAVLGLQPVLTISHACPKYEALKLPLLWAVA